MKRNDLTPDQARAVRRLEHAVKACASAGLAVVADFDFGLRIMARGDLDADDLREHGFTIDVDGNCGCPLMPRVDRSGNG